MSSQLTPRQVALLANLEGLVRESYLDTSNVWTWSMGVTSASGINVGLYKDNPQSIVSCLKAAINRINYKYLPPVLRAFQGVALTEPQLAAALSFEWNTGAISKAQWVKDFAAHNLVAAQHDLTHNYLNAGVLKGRRDKEAALFFDGVWPADMRAAVWSVHKPSYKLAGDTPTDIMPMLHQIMGGS